MSPTHRRSPHPPSHLGIRTSTPSSSTANPNLPPNSSPIRFTSQSFQPRVSLGDHILPVPSTPGGPGQQQWDLENDLVEEDAFDLAREYFEGKELERAASTLAECKSKKAVFLRLYATYLVSGQVYEETMEGEGD